jgi:hypothetical protein
MQSAFQARWFALASLVFLSLLNNSRAAAISNLGNFNNGDYSIYQSSPIASCRAEPFTTGSDAMILDSATLAMDANSATTNGGFSVSLYSNGSDGMPNASLLTLSGSAAPQTGNYTYTAPSSFTLAPNATYWIVAMVPLTGDPTYYNWTFTVNSAFTALPGWSMGASALRVSFYGSAPSWSQATMPLRMEIDATPVSTPEPSTACLLAFAGVLPLTRRFRRAA